MVILAARLPIRVQQNIGIIRGGVNRGLSSEAIQGLIRGTGQTGIRRQDLLQGIRHVRGIAESGLNIRNTRRDRFPDPSRIPLARGPMISNFSYDLRIGPELNRDGTRNQRFITVRSDRNLRPQDMLDEAEAALEQAGELARYARIADDEELTIIGARRK